MASKYLKEALKEASSYSQIFVEKSLDVVEQIQEILEKNAITQRDLADKLGKNESEISKWLSPGHNLTLKTIAKIEDALGETILFTPKKSLKKVYRTDLNEEQILLVKEDKIDYP